MRLGKLALISTVAATVLCSSALAAPGKLLDKGSDRGLPTAFARGTALNPKALLIRITATPNRPVQVSWDTSCARKRKGKVRDGEYTVTGRKLMKVGKGFKRPTDCYINVLAGFEDASQEGKLKIEIFARGPRARRG